MTRAWIGLGSNLDGPTERIRQALHWLDTLPHTTLAHASSLYGSTPVGPADQPDFINAVAELDTALPPLALLDELQALEQRAGRVRQRHWGERTLDLDLLLYGDQVVDEPRLQVPHPEMSRRGFVLEPLAELAPTLCLPDNRRVDTLRAACADPGVWYHGPSVVRGEDH